MYSVFMITVYIHVCCFRGPQGRLAMPSGQPSLNKDVTYLLSAEQAGLSLTWSQPPKTGFLMTRLKLQTVMLVQYDKRILSHGSVCSESRPAMTTEYIYLKAIV